MLGISDNSMRDFVLNLAHQDSLKVLGVGAAAIVYEVNDDIVLKACWTYQHPTCDAPAQQWADYSDSTLFSLDLIRQEKKILQILEKQPHPNIAEAIAIDKDEGIYLRRYTPLSQMDGKCSQAHRILYYRDILCGLNHLHSLGICHSDLRPDNILLTRGHRSRALLCDFSKASLFDEPNTIPDAEELVPLTGPAKAVSDTTDRFAMACFIFEMEIGIKPVLATLRDGSIALPPVTLRHSGLDSIITKAWTGQYLSTLEMLAEVESFAEQSNNENRDGEQSVSGDELRQQVQRWRQDREDRFGNRLLSHFNVIS